MGNSKKKFFSNKFLSVLTVWVLTFSLMPQAVSAIVMTASPDDCLQPVSCTEDATCSHIIEPVPEPGDVAFAALGADIVELYPEKYAQYKNVDDTGTYGGGASYTQDLDFSVPAKYQGSEWNLLAFWWRMHDHEKNTDADLKIHYVTGAWVEVASNMDVHTSGVGCEENCSDGSPPTHEGCSDILPEPHICDATHRLNWPCAISFDEYIWRAPASGAGAVVWPAQPIDTIRLHFARDNEHVHVNDYWMVFGRKAPCGICIPSYCATSLALASEKKFAAEPENYNVREVFSSDTLGKEELSVKTAELGDKTRAGREQKSPPIFNFLASIFESAKGVFQSVFNFFAHFNSPISFSKGKQ